MSSTSSRLHPASLVDPAQHSPALLELVNLTISESVVEYVVDCVSETVDHAMGRAPPPPTWGRARSSYTTKFTAFVATVLSRAEVSPSTLLTALVYVARARPHLSISLEEWALERVFLGALIAASKYTNDSTLKNVHWALCTGVFGKRDVGRIEREFLDVLDWELGVRAAEVEAHYEALVVALGEQRCDSPPRRPLDLHPASSRQHSPAPRRHARNPSVPELEPSSPASSAASMSPRTPASHSSPPHPHPHAKGDVPVPMDVDPAPHTHAHKGGKLHDLLDAFPMPRGIRVAA
ncbi:hypothetical protein B0H15DRAFT_781186 [Mycena belliarum]|uniref:Cyclin N-terminal domain-containing protein n=1 Tax=Mycena belliarum TaxID=1033014 RepID=A0AAD6U3V1_9AGAR|nr:hypothetical protein B0H15DRAFT_781186 [Mycena belliae]